jgi:hypothetical protein
MALYVVTWDAGFKFMLELVLEAEVRVRAAVGICSSAHKEGAADKPRPECGADNHPTACPYYLHPFCHSVHTATALDDSMQRRIAHVVTLARHDIDPISLCRP